MHAEALHFQAEFCRALAHPTRLAIVELLRDEKELSVHDIQSRLTVPQANVSQHLAVLRSKQLVTTRKVGNQVLYHLRDRTTAGKILDAVGRCFQTYKKDTLKLLQKLPEEGSRGT